MFRCAQNKHSDDRQLREKMGPSLHNSRQTQKSPVLPAPHGEVSKIHHEGADKTVK